MFHAVQRDEQGHRCRFEAADRLPHIAEVRQRRQHADEQRHGDRGGPHDGEDSPYRPWPTPRRPGGSAAGQVGGGGCGHRTSLRPTGRAGSDRIRRVPILGMRRWRYSEGNSPSFCSPMPCTRTWPTVGSPPPWWGASGVGASRWIGSHHGGPCLVGQVIANNLPATARRGGVARERSRVRGEAHRMCQRAVLGVRPW